MDKKRKKSDEEASTSGTVRSVSKKTKVLSKLSLTVGIPNPENICYMSSDLQILANVKSYTLTPADKKIRFDASLLKVPLISCSNLVSCPPGLRHIKDSFPPASPVE